MSLLSKLKKILPKTKEEKHLDELKKKIAEGKFLKIEDGHQSK
jgi:hypothetical protein